MTLSGSPVQVVLVLIITALAVHQATNVIRRSSLFAPLRNRFELGLPIWMMPNWTYSFFQQLIECPWCLSVELSWILLLPFVGDGQWAIQSIGRVFVYMLAVSLLANLLHLAIQHHGPKQAG